MDRVKLRGLYARLIGIRSALPFSTTCAGTISDDYDLVVGELTDVLEVDMSGYALSSQSVFIDAGGVRAYCYTEELRSKLLQAISFLEHVHHVSSQIIEIGSIYNSIEDEELKSRCSDLLSAPSNFDRVINQATQVLEDRIRRKSNSDADLTGVQLVNNVMKTDIQKSVLELSSDEGEHRGYCDLARGLMSAFRNPTHHQITDQFSRGDYVVAWTKYTPYAAVN